MRLLRTGLDAAEVTPRIPALVDALYARDPDRRRRPVHGLVRLPRSRGVMEQGAAWAVEPGPRRRDADLERIESGGRLAGAEPSGLSARA